MKHQRKPKKALKVTVNFSEKQTPSASMHHGGLPPVDVVTIRKRTGLSQSAFADSIGVPQGTIINWEQGRRRPSGPAMVLLALLAKKPNLVAELYPQPQPRTRWALGCPDPNNMTAEGRLAEIGQILAIGILRMRSHQNRQARPRQVQSHQADRREAANESIRSAISRSPKTTL